MPGFLQLYIVQIVIVATKLRKDWEEQLFIPAAQIRSRKLLGGKDLSLMAVFSRNTVNVRVTERPVRP